MKKELWIYKLLKRLGLIKTYSTNVWNDLTEVSPPVNKAVELKIIINGEERIYTDRLIPMMDCTYIWQYGDYSGCDGEAAWRYISKQ